MSDLKEDIWYYCECLEVSNTKEGVSEMMNLNIAGEWNMYTPFIKRAFE